MRVRTVAVLVAAILLAACGDRLETRTFPLKHVTAASIRPLIAPYVNTPGSTIGEGTAAFPSIAVRERPDVLDAIAAMVAQHDKPQPTVTLHFKLIEADGFTTSDPAIADVEKALRKLFRFSGYRLLADAVMSNVTPMITVPAKRENWADYQVQQKVRVGEREYIIFTDVRTIKRGDDGAAAAELAVLLFDEGTDKIPGEELIATSIRVPDGQTVVLGNAMGKSTDHTIILTVQPEIH